MTGPPDTSINGSTAASVSDAPPLLEARALHFAYGTRVAVDRVELHVDAGELVGLVGPNGSGKSTLLSLLLGALPGRGQVLLSGERIDRMAPRLRAQRITLVAQDTHVELGLQVRDIVALGRFPHRGRFGALTARDHELVDQAMAAADICDLADRPITALSGGERQRVHIARAIAQQTAVILLDEPTASLDLAHQLDLLARLRELARSGCGLLVSLHDLNLAARSCDRVLVLERGRVVASGPPHEVLTPELLARHFHVEAKVSRDEQGHTVIAPLRSL